MAVIQYTCGACGDQWGFVGEEEPQVQPCPMCGTDTAPGDALAFVLGEHEEICSLRNGGPVVHIDGAFAVVRLYGGGFYLIYGDRDSYCDGSREEGESEFETLAGAVAELELAKAAFAPEEDAALKAAWDAT